jgi:hypothetical protein
MASDFLLARGCNGTAFKTGMFPITHDSTHNCQLDLTLEHPKEMSCMTRLKWSEDMAFDAETIEMALLTGRIKWSEELAVEINKRVLYSLSLKSHKADPIMNVAHSTTGIPIRPD